MAQFIAVREICEALPGKKANPRIEPEIVPGHGLR